MFKILFLEFYYNLSDVEVVKQLKFNVLFRYFAQIKIEDPLPDDASLVVFRKRLGEERFERIFDKFIKQCEKNGFLEGKLKTIDATHIIADVAIPNTVNLLKEGRERILRAIKKEKKELDESLKRYLPEKEPPQKLTKEKLVKELTLSKELIEEVQGKYSSKVEEIAHLLEEVVDPTEKRKLVSFVDPDARFGRKSKDKKFAGYKAHIVEDESQIVTSCETLPGNENEGSEANLESMLQKEDKKELKTEAIVCDALYDSLSNRLKIEKRKKKHYIPEKREKKRVNDFIYSDKEDKLICGKGYSSIGKTRQEDGYLYYFSCSSCRGCDRRKRCSFNKDRARIYVSDSHLLYLKADPKERKKALEKRKRIEAKFAEAKKHHQMARARYRGRWRVAIQVFMTFIVMNLKRMVKLFKTNKAVAKLAFSSG
jgi:IS5 family transposase